MITGWSYFGIRNPDHAARDLDNMAENGANAVLLTCSEEDMAFYAGTMERLAALARERGMTVYMNPWAVGGVFGGEAFSGLLMREPDIRQVASDGLALPAACPNHPEFREFLRGWVDLAAACGADIAMWDEPHFHILHGRRATATSWSCRCAVCRAAFRERYGEEMPTEATPAVGEFRAAVLLDFLDELTAYAREKGLANSVCLLPGSFGLDSGAPGFEAVAQLDSVDIIATDPYWQPETPEDTVAANYRRYSRELAALARQHGKQAEMWVMNFRIAAGQEHRIEIATREIIDAGVERILAWSYLGSAYMSLLSSDDPHRVYQTQARAFTRARGQARPGGHGPATGTHPRADPAPRGGRP